MDSPNSESSSSTDSDMTKRRKTTGRNTKASSKATKGTKLPTVHEEQNPANVQPFLQDEDQNDEDSEQSVTESRGSASTMCGSERKFNGWAQEYHVLFFDPNWADKGFTDFMNRQKYPAYIKSAEIITSLQDILSINEIDMLEIDTFDVWRRGLVTEREDPYAFQAFSQYVTGLWISMLPKIETPENEATYRAPIDMILELAFQLRPRAGQLYRKEMELALPGEPEVIIADGIATKALPRQWNRYTLQLKKWNFSWNYSYEALSTITLVFEAKVKELAKGRRQVQMGLLSAQMQRRALCMKDGPVFGALLDDGLLRLYVSVWQKDQLAIRPVYDPLPLFSLKNFFEIYFILCRIAEFQAQWLEKEFKRWSDESISQMEKLNGSKIWRKERRTKSRKGSQAGGDTDVQDAEEEAEGEARDDLEKVELDDDEEVKCFRMAAARDPFPKDGYFLTRKRLYVLIKMPKDNQCSRKQLVSDWAQRTSACAGEYMHMYSPEYDADFKGDTTESDDSASTTVGDSESDVGTLVKSNAKSYGKSLDDMTMVEKKSKAASWHKTTIIDGKFLMDEPTCSTKYFDATSTICCHGEVDGPSVLNQVTPMIS